MINVKLRLSNFSNDLGKLLIEQVHLGNQLWCPFFLRMLPKPTILTVGLLALPSSCSDKCRSRFVFVDETFQLCARRRHGPIMHLSTVVGVTH